MEEFNFIEYLRTEKRLNNYQIGKIQELLDSFVKDDSHSHASFEFCPKCGKFHPHVIRSGFAGSGKQLTDARNVADALFEPVSQERKKRSNSESKRLTKGHEEMNL